MHILIAFLIISFGPPGKPFVKDLPNDDGGKIIVTWELSPDDSLINSYDVFRTAGNEETLKVGSVPKKTGQFIDNKARDGIEYRYQISAVKDGEAVARSEYSEPITSSSQWFHTSRINILVGIIIYTAILLYFIYHARRGRQMFIRRIPGLDALEEAVGRATEMGRPILYIPGLSTIDDIATIASLNILSKVAKKTAEYNTKLIVPNRSPVVYIVAREIVKESYTDAGRPDAFNPDDVYFITENQWAYVAAVCGIMVREKPATNLFLGYFWAESLALAETGASTGAIQIAGTDSIFQLPFFITACDYTLIGEELYAASAYLSREPLLMGSIKGQDWGKIIILIVLIISSILVLAGLTNVLSLFNI